MPSLSESAAVPVQALTVSELASREGLHPETVRRHIKRGALDAIKVHPRLLLIPLSAYINWRTSHGSER